MTVLTRGIPGTAMPSFALLSDEERRSVIGYIRHFSPSLSLAGAQESPTKDTPPVWVRDQAAIAAGKAAYTRLGCPVCHGAKGRGDGAIAASLQDDKNLPIRPRDLVGEALKGGSSVRDIYHRITNGMDGTPMSPFAGATEKERWQIASYVASINEAGKKAAAGPNPFVISAKLLKGSLPERDPFASAWKAAPVTAVPMFPLTANQELPRHLAVRALHNGETISFLLEWDDATRNDGPVKVEAFTDGVALQWAAASNRSFLGMGSRDAPVRIWHWKADWERVLAERKAPPAAPAASTPDVPYAFPVLPAVDAKNPVAVPSRMSSVEEVSAIGFQTLTPVPTQKVSGIGIWKKGKWRVVLSRDLDNTGADAHAQPTAKLAMAVWDGASRERAAWKSISGWYELRFLNGSARDVAGGR